MGRPEALLLPRVVNPESRSRDRSAQDRASSRAAVGGHVRDGAEAAHAPSRVQASLSSTVPGPVRSTSS